MGSTHEVLEVTNYRPPAKNTYRFIATALKLVLKQQRKTPTLQQ